jgi:hypothetical protein
MAASITHTQTRTDTVPPVPDVYPSIPNTLDAKYRVVDVVTATVNIDPEVFVYRYSDWVFDHVATVLDMEQIQELTPTPGAPFYRQNYVVRDFASESQAAAFAEELISRMERLALEYVLYPSTFVGTTTGTLPPP